MESSKFLVYYYGSTRRLLRRHIDYSFNTIVLIKFQAKMNHHYPMMILGITGVVGGFSVLLLPETSNIGLAATLEDIEEESR